LIYLLTEKIIEISNEISIKKFLGQLGFKRGGDLKHDFTLKKFKN